MTTFFPILIMNARPGAGKSEITHFLSQIPIDERIARFHIGPIHVLDDFPMLWTWFEEDDLLEQVFGRSRVRTTPDRHFLHHDLWHLLIRRLSLEYEKWMRDAQQDTSVLIEFSRGVEQGGYRTAYDHLSDSILQQAACLYVQVSYQESLRKNRVRFNPERPHSILQHSMSDKKMEHLYRHDDWKDLTADHPSLLSIRGLQVPYVIFENEDDVTTNAGPPLGERLETILGRLWTLWQEQHGYN